MANPESSQVTSDDLRKRIDEQTRMLMDAATSPTATRDDSPEEFDAQTEETEKTEQTEEAETKETEETQAETETEAETKPEVKETLHKLKVLGEEEELPLERILALAQIERAREKKNERVAPKEKELAEREQRLSERERQIKGLQEETGWSRKKADEWFDKQIEEQGATATLSSMIMAGVRTILDQDKAEQKNERAFEKSKLEEEPDIWKSAKPIYEEYREQGHPKDLAYQMAKNDVLMKALAMATQKGITDGEKKAKLKAKADLGIGGKKTGIPGKVENVEDFRKLSAAEMKKRLPKSQPPDGW